MIKAIRDAIHRTDRKDSLYTRVLIKCDFKDYVDISGFYSCSEVFFNRAFWILNFRMEGVK